MRFNCSYSELVELHKLVPNPRNTNQHGPRQIALLAKIIDYQGQRAPIVVSKRSGFITKGHARLMALQKLKWEKAAVDFQYYESEAQEYADLEADNRIAELAERDEEKFRVNADEIFGEGFDFELAGSFAPLDGWDSDIEDEKAPPNLAGLDGVVKVSCQKKDYEEVKKLIMETMADSEFEGINVR